MNAMGSHPRDIVQASSVPEIPVNTNMGVLITGICKGARLRNSAHYYPRKIRGDRHASLFDWRNP